MTSEVRGLVLRAVDWRESDRLLTVYTEEQGLITVLARGARSMKSRKMAACQQFCYATFQLTKQGEYLRCSSAELIESFFELRATLAGMALAGYICEVMCYVCTADPEPELLRLALNSLFAIAGKKAPFPQIKAVFEARCAAIIGFMPEVSGCYLCGEKNGSFSLDVMDGQLTCAACREKAAFDAPADDDGHELRLIVLLPEGAKFAFDYAVHCPQAKLFSFRIPPEDFAAFSDAAEKYLLHHLERDFPTLDFYREVTQ